MFGARPIALLLTLLISAAAYGQDHTSTEKDPEMAPKSGAPHTHTNRLIDETSPYLLQHAHNPVDWYPWGDEALAKSKAEDKPIFLSIGYSSCHWCHVMERESFENDAIASVMNEHYVNIKVDREERPDLDEIYMTAVQAMTGSGGWPMSVWLTPDLKPFYGGTYYPPEPSRGMPGFKMLLEGIARAWSERRAEAVQSADRLTEHMSSILGGVLPPSDDLSANLIAAGVRDLAASFDAEWGGFGSAPKFPSSPSIQLLLREYDRTHDTKLLDMVTTTLDKMAYGGLYDHLGGGFARYSTDERWLVPHFEKMLYDNAQLAQAYLEAFQVTKDPFYKHIVEETLNYVLHDMRDVNGGFHSAEDADSEGEEGKFYIWTYDEIIDALGEEEGKLFAEFYNCQPDGNFSSHETYHAGKNILYVADRLETFAAERSINTDNLKEQINAMRDKLLAIRSQRIRPGLDDKVLTSWNALMISAFAQSAQVFDDNRYRDAATEAASFILTDMTKDGDLLRTHRKGESRIPAYLDDYAYFILALVDVYEATFDPKWLDAADALSKRMLAKFWDSEHGGFYFTSDDHVNLIVRTRPTYDGATPSGNSMAVLALQRLGVLLDNDDYRKKAETVLQANHAYLSQAPRGYLKMLLALDLHLYPPKEIAIVGAIESADTKALLRAVHSGFVPNKVVASVDPSSADAKQVAERIPLLAGKTLVDGKPAAYVCKNYACQLPVTTPDALLKQLGSSVGQP